MSGEVQKWGDVAMFEAEPMSDPQYAKPGEIKPGVTIVSMTPRPIQVMACASEMYRGRSCDWPAGMPREDCEYWWDEMTRTALKAPLEFIDLHFLIEGVTRSFTHQMVRQRTAVYTQESLRFAVKRNARLEVAIPPSIASLKDDDPARVLWDQADAYDAHVYNALIDAGIPAEDARQRLPHGITTRLHYKTNLRNLADQAGLRLCSQAQFEWKQVWAQMLEAIRSYGPREEQWQQLAIANLFRPICYRTGRCEFRGKNDRACSIRDRVEAHFRAGEGPEDWDDINPIEPLMYGAAIVRPGADNG